MRDFTKAPQPVPLPVQAVSDTDEVPVNLLQLSGDGARLSTLIPDRLNADGNTASLRGPRAVPHPLTRAGRP
jgi:hypothetical protein